VEVKIINLVQSGMVSKLSKRKSCILVFTDAVKTLVGEENKRRGTIKMFEVLQDTRLNKQLFYVSDLSFPLKIHFYATAASAMRWHIAIHLCVCVFVCVCVCVL
jgi:hypothetical protein